MILLKLLLVSDLNPIEITDTITKSSERLMTAEEQGLISILGTLLVISFIALAYLFISSRKREDSIHQRYQRVISRLDIKNEKLTQSLMENTNALVRLTSNSEAQQKELLEYMKTFKETIQIRLDHQNEMMKNQKNDTTDNVKEDK